MPGDAPVTLLFTDVEGSTQLVRELRDRYGEVLGEHRRLVREAIARHGGREIDTQGDSFFVAFSAPESAVLAAANIQRALAEHEWPSGGRLRVRIGIHTGRADEHDGRYTGLAVHRAARVCAAAHGGQILVTQTVRGLLEDNEEELAAVRLRPVGEHQLKDFDRPVGLFDVAPDGLEEAFPPPRTGVDSTPAAAPVPLWRRGRVALAAAAVVFAAAAFLGVVTRPWERDDPPAVLPNSVVGIDPESNEVAAVVRVPARPEAVAAAAGRLWVTSVDQRVLIRVEPESGDVQTSGIDAAAVAPDGRGSVWVVPRSARRSPTDPGPLRKRPVVYRVDAETMQVTRRIRVPGVPLGVVVGGGFAWFTGSDSPHYDRGPGMATAVEVATGRRAFAIPVEGTPFETAFGAGALWAANYDSGTVSVIRPGSARAKSFSVAQGPLGIAVSHGSVWVTDYWTDNVVRLDAVNGKILRQIPVGEALGDVIAADGSIWVATRGTRTIARIDPRSNRIEARIRLPYRPEHLAAGLDRVWAVMPAEDNE